ncbi:MAG: ATP-binding protein, partial [Bacteroidales bacterium]|nr:ATP-binding protein [Bacteroidales bacterium]
MFKSVHKEEIQVPAHINYLGELRNFVTKTGRKHHFSDTVVNAFKLSIDEAATNIIKHAYRDWEGEITMRVIIKKESMTVVLIDKGKYFDPSRVKDPDLNRYVNIGKKGGLGIFIMRKLLDEIDYRHTEEGNELRLTKYRESKSTKKRTGKKKIISTPSLSMSLKSRYSIVTAAILTGIVILGYFYFFIIHGNRVLRDFIASEKPVCENIAKNVLQSGEFELNPLFVDSKVLEFIHSRNEIYRIVVTDFENMVVSSTDTSLVFEEFQVPANHENPRPNLISYKDKQNETIYNFSCNVTIDDIQKTKIGTVYLEVKKDHVSSKIASLRMKDLRTAVLILALGYLGIMFLIYI